jgi:hypothetical protein
VSLLIEFVLNPSSSPQALMPPAAKLCMTASHWPLKVACGKLNFQLLMLCVQGYTRQWQTVN